MAASSTDICNLALGHLGEAPIVNLGDDDVAARACSLHYADTLDEILRSHRWNFAIKRDTLSSLTPAPAFGWTYRYQLPEECLRVVEFNGSDAGDWLSSTYVIEGRELLTNASSAQVIYVQRITDVSLFDPLFVKALAVKLAIVLSESMRGSTGKTTELLELYQSLVAPLARRIDANEGNRRKGTLPVNSAFVRARRAVV